MEKVSLIATVLNEKDAIGAFLDSIAAQSHQPDEVIIVDAGSTDGTWEALQKAKTIIAIQEKGNRSHGRNTAIRRAKHTLSAVSDVGCTLSKDWLQKLLLTQKATKADVVAGFYTASHPGQSVFQKALASYTCTMPDQLDPETFLPSSRSILFTRDAWEAVGGYPEQLDTCEDLMFAQALKQSGQTFAMAADARVIWPQKTTFYAAAKQLYGYAYGDGQAGYIRRTIPLLYGRYIVGIVLLGTIPLIYCAMLAGLYVAWSIAKNYRYVTNWRAFYILPALQCIADVAVMTGMLHGYLTRHER